MEKEQDRLTKWRTVRRFLSHDSGPFAQFVKYGVIGVLSTCVQMIGFYLLAATCLKCLGADDWAVRFLGLPSVEVSDGVRAFRAAVATAGGFTVANIFCWMMNRLFVFKPGKFRWYVEFLMFFGVAALATVVALGVQSLLIKYFGMMTTAAVIVEVVASFLMNFFVRKFVIFKG
ncbi:MAG: GtrA family protein [Kiritimatiellae bacterium]|nr:GtrA family protein [Kiritimatiellia bacterium]